MAHPNKLKTVTDGSGGSYNTAGFMVYPTGSASGSYTYDANGNLMFDPYKNLTFDPYNVLNKTSKITLSTGNYVDYTYDATGNLIRKRQFVSGTVSTTTDYIDGFVYVNSTLSYFPMPEGRVVNNSGTLVQEFVITDQQGNARISFWNNGSNNAIVRQENSYYAFGLIMPGSTVGTPATPNKNLYNGGSEWQSDFGNLPDYYQTFNRNYDAAIGRFVGVDPAAEGAESLTSYQYAGNNPIMYNDPLGDLIKLPLPQFPAGYGAGTGSAANGDDESFINYSSGYGGGDGDDDFSAFWSTVLSAVSDILQSTNTNKSAFGYDFEDPDALFHLAFENPGDYNLSVNDGALTLTAIDDEASATNAGNAGAGNLATGSSGNTQYLASTSNESFMEMNANQGGTFYPDGSAFFKNETQAYNYMWKNSNYGKSNYIENFAFITKNGVAVLPTHGTKSTGEAFQNTGYQGEWYGVYQTKGQGSTFAIDFQGIWIYPIASIHTHPGDRFGDNESPDGYDLQAFRSMGIPGFVLGHDHLYGVSLNGDYSTYPAQNLLRGIINIIPNIGLFK